MKISLTFVAAIALTLAGAVPDADALEAAADRDSRSVAGPPPLAGFVAHVLVEGGISLSWTFSEDTTAIQGVRIRYSTSDFPSLPDDGLPVPESGSGEEPGEFPGWPGSSRDFIHMGIDDSRRYFYSAFVFDDARRYSQAAETAADAWDTTTPDPVEEASAVGGDGRVTLTWRNPGSGDFYGTLIRYSLDRFPPSYEDDLPVENGQNGLFVGIPGDTLTFVHKPVTNGKHHRYRFFSIDRSNNVDTLGATASAFPSDPGPPGNVIDFQIAEQDGRLVLHWTNPNDDDFEGTLIRFSDSRVIGSVTDGDPVPNGNDGLFHGLPSSVDSFVHEGLVYGKTYHYGAFAFDEVPQYGEVISRSGSPMDLTPPMVTVGVLQNPFLTERLDLVIVSSEPLASGEMRLVRNDFVIDTLLLAPLDEAGMVWKGDFTLVEDGAIRLLATAVDSAGNEGEGESEFSAVRLLKDHEGFVADPGGSILVEVPSGGLPYDVWALIVPDNRAPETYVLHPRDLLLSRRALLRIKIPPGSAGGFDEDPCIIRDLDRERDLETWIDHKRGEVVALIQEFGRFALSEGAAVRPPALDGHYLALHSNRPNPFNPSTTIRYELRSRGRVRIEIYDVTGRLIRLLVDENAFPGQREVVWNGLDGRGRDVPSGVYVYLVKTPVREVSGRMTLIR